MNYAIKDFLNKGLHLETREEKFLQNSSDSLSDPEGKEKPEWDLLPINNSVVNRVGFCHEWMKVITTKIL